MLPGAGDVFRKQKHEIGSFRVKVRDLFVFYDCLLLAVSVPVDEAHIEVPPVAHRHCY